MRHLAKLVALAVALAGMMVHGAELTAAAQSPRTMVVYQAVLRNGFAIRHDHSEPMQGLTRLYLSSASNSGYVDIPTAEILRVEREEIPLPPQAAAGDVDQIVSQASDRHQVDEALINSVIRAESGFNPKAVSPKGAQGLMQLMPQTATRLGVNNAFEPSQNVDGGTRYLRQLLEQYHGDMAKALAAYNAGPQRVSQYHGVPPYHETHAYVARVIRDFNRSKLAENPALKTKTKAASRKPRQAAPTSRAVSAP
jgi:hypothetical protein